MKLTPKEQYISDNLLEEYLETGANGCARRFKIPSTTVLKIMREAGVPVRPRGGAHHKNGQPAPVASIPERRSSNKHLTKRRRAALRAEFVPGKRGENARLAKKYGVSTPSVTYLTKHLRPQ